MQSVVIRDTNAGDFETICALNLAEVQHTSPMNVARLGELHGLASYHRVACIDGAVVAFLLAMRNGALYLNENFEWFSRKFPQFIYIDRVVVSAETRGLRIGSILYNDLFVFARGNAIPLVACEYNIVPPNEPSASFHGKFGFTEQGTQWVADGTKCVSLQVSET